MLGTRTPGGRMEGANEFTELWRHPNFFLLKCSIATHQSDQILKLKVAKNFQKLARAVFTWRVLFFKVAQKLPYTWATFVNKFVTKNFRKLANLITLPLTIIALLPDLDVSGWLRLDGRRTRPKTFWRREAAGCHREDVAEGALDRSLGRGDLGVRHADREEHSGEGSYWLHGSVKPHHAKFQTTGIPWCLCFCFTCSE